MSFSSLAALTSSFIINLLLLLPPVVALGWDGASTLLSFLVAVSAYVNPTKHDAPPPANCLNDDSFLYDNEDVIVDDDSTCACCHCYFFHHYLVLSDHLSIDNHLIVITLRMTMLCFFCIASKINYTAWHSKQQKRRFFVFCVITMRLQSIINLSC